MWMPKPSREFERSIRQINARKSYSAQGDRDTLISGIPSLQKLTLLAEVIYQTKNKPNNLYLS